MKAYSLSVNLKLGLIIFAVLIAVTSLAYTQRLVDRLRDREQSIIELWAEALAQLPKAQEQSINPYQVELQRLEALLAQMQLQPTTSLINASELEAMRRAVLWAQGMPQAQELGFITEAIIIPNSFGIPTIVTDSSSQRLQNWRNIDKVPDLLEGLSSRDSLRYTERLKELTVEMADTYPPVPIEVDFGEQLFKQYVYYGESSLVRELRIFPYLQLLFVGLFILLGYLGFSYVRRSEQSSLWVGMAKEAAHQLGTPISSLMGWLQLLRGSELPARQYDEALDEIENDITRLHRVANRFSDIGSLPKLEVMVLEPVLENITDYMRRRIPQRGKSVSLVMDIPDDLSASINNELFQWVIENLIKNALDAIETNEGTIKLKAWREETDVIIEVKDTGKGIDRRQWKNVFRPGYSTKKRGWGLGLSLSKRIIEDYHGGELTLESSRVGQGSTFRIVLPQKGRG